MAKTGRPSKGERKGTTVRLPAETHQELKVYCALKNIDLSDILSDAIVVWWEKHSDREATREAIEKNKAA